MCIRDSTSPTAEPAWRPTNRRPLPRNRNTTTYDTLDPGAGPGVEWRLGQQVLLVGAGEPVLEPGLADEGAEPFDLLVEQRLVDRLVEFGGDLAVGPLGPATDDPAVCPDRRQRQMCIRDRPTTPSTPGPAPGSRVS